MYKFNNVAVCHSNAICRSLVLLWWQEFATRFVAVFLLTRHCGVGAGGSGEYRPVSRLGLLIWNRWMSRLRGQDCPGCPAVLECTNCSLHTTVGGALSETVATVSLSTVPRLSRQFCCLWVRKHKTWIFCEQFLHFFGKRSLTNCRYCVDCAQNLPEPAPHIWLTLFQISSKSIYCRRSYCWTHEDRFWPVECFQYRLFESVIKVKCCLAGCLVMIVYGDKKYVSVCFIYYSWAAEQRHSQTSSRHDIQDTRTGEVFINTIDVSNTTHAGKYYSVLYSCMYCTKSIGISLFYCLRHYKNEL